MSETTGLGGLDVAWGIFTMGHTQQEPLGPPLGQTGSLAVQ